MQINHYPELDSPLNILYDSAKVVFDSHISFLIYYKRIDTDFIFDQKLQTYFVGLSGQHVDHMACLYRFHGGQEDDNYKAADLYVYQNYGIFKSRASHRILASESFRLPPELTPLLRDIERLPCPIQF